VQPTVPQDDETIVPVRPPPRSGRDAGSAAPAMAGAPRKAVRTAIAAAIAGVALLAVAVAFYWLPARIEEQRTANAPPAAAPAPVAVEPALPALTPEQEAALKAEAERLLAALLTLDDRLTDLGVDVWATEDWERYRQISDDGDNTFLANDFRAAVAGYTAATELGNALVARAADAVAKSLKAAESALVAGDADLARRQFDIVLAIEPDHAAALAGRARAERLPEVLAHLQQAEQQRARGELTAALASYRAALAIDSQWEAASVGVAEVNRVLRDGEFERLLSAGFSALTSEDFAEARERFEAALALRPSSREAREGIAQAEEGAQLDKIQLTEARALAFERRELWDQAIALYRSVLESDPTLVFAQTGLERANARAGLDAKMRNLIDNPNLLLGDTVLTDARALLAAAAAEEQKGAVLEGQIAALSRLVEMASAPIPVRLTSDQLTNVTLYRVGTLGAFATRDVELRPGTYTAIGSRDGYRDVRQTFTVRPGRNLPPISVVCVEPI
jgi:tetratricopeptide (TPR) repeat protein